MRTQQRKAFERRYQSILQKMPPSENGGERLSQKPINHSFISLQNRSGFCFVSLGVENFFHFIQVAVGSLFNAKFTIYCHYLAIFSIKFFQQA